MSNQMNPWLASIYGTDGADDLEKTAQAHLLHKLAADQNLDISQLSPEEMEQMIQELAAEGYDIGALMQSAGHAPTDGMSLPGAGGAPQGQPQRQGFAPAQAAQQPQMPQGMNPSMMQGGQAPQQDAAAMQKEAQAKFEEADLLGRVMAHAYTDELEKIASHRTKTAGRFEGAKGAVKGAVGKASQHVGKNRKAYAAGAAGVAAGEAHGRMSKKASAFEKLAEEHAAEILAATGYDPASGQDLLAQPEAQPEQVSNDQQQAQAPEQAPVGGEQFGQALDNRALEMLAENGYDVNEILARLQLAQNQPAQA